MLKRIAAILFIFACASVAWMILAGTISYRSSDSDSGLHGRVASTWGAQHEQKPPTASYTEDVIRAQTSLENGRKVERAVHEAIAHSLPLESSRIRVALQLEPRQKGLLWFSTYKVAFDGIYTFRNPTAEKQAITFTLKFPAAQATYVDLVWTADGAALQVRDPKNAATAVASVDPEKTISMRVAYRSQGLDCWNYNFGSEVSQVRDFALRITTN